MQWCQHCVLPDTRPNLRIGEDGICNACKLHNSKSFIDWPARQDAFHTLIRNIKNLHKPYDCVIPVSGGKDSTWQVLTCLEYGLKPLAVTWKPPSRTAIGRQNLDNLIALGVDHIDWQINPKVEARFMRNAFERFGSTAIPMHMAIYNIPLNIALRFDIPLIVYGENSAFEYGNQHDKHTGFELTAEWLQTYGVTHGTTAADWISDELSEQDLSAYFAPSGEQLQSKNIRAIFLGYYFAWDPQLTYQLAKQHGFHANTHGARTGYYNYADIDDDFISVHHWMKWYKFGFTRLFDNLSLEIRNARMTRRQALELIKFQGAPTPRDDIRKLCQFIATEEDYFYSVAQRFRNTGIWKQRNDGIWYLPEFIIDNWHWE